MTTQYFQTVNFLDQVSGRTHIVKSFNDGGATALCGYETTERTNARQVPSELATNVCAACVRLTSMTDKQLFAKVRALGLTISKRDGEYRINLRDGAEATAYYTNDKTDALTTARCLLTAHYFKHVSAS